MGRYLHPDMDGIFGGAAFALPDGRKFPRSFWRTASAQEIADLGFVEHVPPEPEPPTLEEMRTAKLAAIGAMMQSVLDAGCPVAVTGGTLHVALDDGSRADLTGMATTAVAALSGAVTWPESYQTGWITMENVRIPLGMPADGLGLAARAGDYYACVRQNGRDLKDAALAAADEAALDAIDIESGWPG